MAASRKHRAAPAVPASAAALLAATALAVIAYAGAQALAGLGFDWMAGSAARDPLAGTAALVALLVWLAFFLAAAAWLGPRLWRPAGPGRPLAYRDRLRRAAQLLGLWALAVAVLALFSGLFAVGADWAARSTLEFAFIRGLVSATALALALAVFPLFAVTAVAALAGGGGFGQDVSRALRRLGRLYAPLVLLALAGAGAGFVVWTLTGRAGAGWLAGAARAAALVVVGGGSIWAVFALAAPVALAPPGAEAPPLHANPRARRAARAAVAAGVAASLLVSVAPGAAEAAGGLAALAAGGAREALAADFSQPVPTTPMAQAPQPGAPLDKPPQEYYPEEDPPEGRVVAVDGEAVTYQTGAGEFTTTLGGPLEAFVDEAGQIQQVDNTLEPVVEPDGEAYFTNGANELKTIIPAEVGPERGIVFQSQGFALELIPLEGDYSHPVVQDNAILYNSVFEGVDIQYTLVGAVVKEDIVLNWPTGRSEFGFKLAPGPGLRVREVDGAIELLAGAPGRGPGGESVVFRLTAPIMQDAAGAVSDAVALELEQAGDGPVARVSADPEWLGAAERAYPVRIDPNLDIAPSAISLIGVEQGSADLHIGDNGYPYSGYDDGLKSGNIANFDAAHMMTRTYVHIDYDFAAGFEDCKINSAVFSLDQRTAWSGGDTNFGLYSVDTAWNPAAITWNNQLNSGHTFIQFQPASANGGRIAWDVREMVNNWAQGLKPNRGLVVKAENERWMQAEVFSNKAASAPPILRIDWEVPPPVDPGLPLAALSVSLYPMTEKSLAGKQVFDAVFAAGLATPESTVSFRLDPGGAPAATTAAKVYKFPNSQPFEATFPEARRYKDALGNWQSGLFGGLPLDTVHSVKATAAKAGGSSGEKSSDKFLVYKVKQRDTYPYIAKYYGVSLNTIMADNAVQDTLVTNNNTLFIRNPKTSVPYNPPPLSDDQKKAIDSALMGRGMHCEYGFEPVNFNTGNFFLEAVDASAAEIDGDFALTRSYNSKADGFQSVFGRNWEFAYAESLSLEEDGTLVYFKGDGRQLRFEPAGGGWLAPEGYHLAVSKIPYTAGDQTYYRWDIAEPSGASRAFNAWGLLTDIYSANGLRTQVGYSAEMGLAKATSPTGLVYEFDLDEAGRISRATLPGGAQTRYEYNEAGDLVAYTDPNGLATRYEYDQEHRLTSWWDGDGNLAVTNTYDAQGRVTTQTNAVGAKVRLAYTQTTTTTTDANGNQTTYTLDSLARVTKIAHPDGQVEERAYGPGNTLIRDELGTYTYDADGNQLTATDLDGATQSRTYDAAGRVLTATDRDGRTTAYQYDARGDLVKAIHPGGGTETFAYDSNHRVVSHTNRRGGTETFTYDGANLASSTDPLGARTTYLHNPMNHVIAVTDPAGGVTRTIRDLAGRVVGEQAADGATREYVLDALGNITRERDPLGHTTAFDYDAAHRVLSGTDAEGAKVAYTYDPNGNTLTETDPAGNTTEHVYDSRDRLVKTTNPDGSHVAYKYDKHGNITELTDALGGVKRVEYDQVSGQPLRSTDPLGAVSEFAYTAEGALTLARRPDGSATKYGFDGAGRVSWIEEPSGLVTRLGYNAAGDLTRIDEAGRVSVFEFDLAGRVAKATDAAGGATVYDYDALGNLARQTDQAGRVTTFAYDPVGRVVAVTEPGGAVTRYAWDLRGDLVQQTAANGATATWARDKIGRVVAEEDALGGVTAYSYDPNGNLASATDPFGNQTSYLYNHLGLATKVTDPLGRVWAYKFDATGNTTEVVNPAGEAAAAQWDAAGRLARQTDVAGVVTEYAYDKASNLVRRQDSTGRVDTFAYDQAGRLTSHRDPVGREESFSYDLWGALTSQTGLDQVSSVYTYDALGQVTAVSNPLSGTVRYAYDKAGNITAQTDVDGAVWRYGYDQAGNLVTETDPLGATTRYAYDALGYVTEQVDPLGAATSFAYDPLSRLTAQTDPRGATSRFEYDAASRLVAVTAPSGARTEYAYDAADQMTMLKDPNGGVRQFKYNAAGLVAEEVSPAGLVTSHAYDKHGFEVASVDPLGNQTRFEVSDRGQVTGLEDANGAKWSYSYDLADRLTQVTTPLGYTQRFSYSAAGDLAESVDNLGRRTSYTYDELRNLTSAVDAAGAKTVYEYNPDSTLAQVTDPLGRTASYTYDLADQLVAQTDAVGRATRLVYDPAGQLVESVEPGARTYRYGYDAAGNLTSVTDPLGGRAASEYDLDGRLVAVVDQVGARVSYSYDPAGQLTAARDAAGGVTGFSYDPDGLLAALTDQAGNTTRYAYDGASRLTRVTQADGAATRYGYDAAGNTTSVTDALGRVTGYSYDLEGNLVGVASPGGSSETSAYDRASRLTASTDGEGKTTRYDYDEVNRLVEASYQDGVGSWASYVYNAAGELVAMEDLTGESAYTYDSLGRLVSAADPAGRRVVYAYTEAGDLESIGYPDGSEVSYGYDAAGNLTTVAAPEGVSRYTYDAAGRVTGLTRPDGSATLYGLGARGEVVSVVNQDAAGAVVSGYRYEFDARGDVVSEESWGEAAGGSATRRFSYDSERRLVGFSESGPDGAEDVSYQYDKAGNRLSMRRVDASGVELESVSYSYGPGNELLQADSTQAGLTLYTYDRAGRLVAQDGADSARLTYQYSAADRLQAVREGGRLLMAATYDGAGNRVFQVSRRDVPAASQAEPAQASAGRALDAAGGVLAAGLAAPAAGSGQAAAPDLVFTYRESEWVDPSRNVFWLGLWSFAAHGAAGLNTAQGVASAQDLSARWDQLGGEFQTATRSVPVAASGGLSQADLDALSAAGLSPAEAAEALGLAGLAEPGSGSALGAGDSGWGGAPIPAPAQPAAGAPQPGTGAAYDLSYYVNDVNRANTEVLAAYGARGQLGASYTYGVDRLAQTALEPDPVAGADRAAGDQMTTSWFLTDGQGSVTARTDASGAVVESLSYDPFGVLERPSGSQAPVFGYNGEEHNPATGLQYLRARYYDPAAGRFSVRDSLLGDPSAPQTLNRYAYALGNPLAFEDPSGHWNLFKAIGGAVSKAASAVASTAKKAATWVNNNVVKPAVTAVKSAARWVNNNVVKPVVSAVGAAAGWVNQNVVQPARSAVSGAVAAAGRVVAAVGSGVAAAYQATARAVRSTAAYVVQRTAELKQKVFEFACTTANKLTSAWEAAKDWAADVDWAKVGMIVGGAVIGVVATVATAGAAGPVVGALIYGALAVDVAFQASDLVEELTGTNLIKDAVFGGNEAAYAAVSLGVGLLGGIGPDDVAKLAGKTDDVVGLASAVGSGSRKAADKADEAASAKSASGASKSDAGAQKRSGCPLGSSFAGATRVVAGDGGSAARIDSLQVGDQVLGQDAATGQTSPETVTAVWSHQSETWALSLSDGQRVETTANHPWYTANRDAWVRTDHLRAGDQLRTAAGAATTVKDVSPTGQTATVWNLTATGAHTYHVTTTNPQAAILVHNADPGELVNPNSCPLTAPGSGTRPPPNPYGKKGGPAHQDEVARVAQDIDARGLGVKTEYRIMTPGGQKGSRWVDVVGIDKQTGQVAELHQVGKQTVRSQVPVARERAAIADIQTRGVATKYIDPGTLKVVFHPYNKP